MISKFLAVKSVHPFILDFTDSKLFKKTKAENFNFISLAETSKGSSAELECKFDGSTYTLSCEQGKKKHKVKIVGSKADNKLFKKCK